MSVRFLLDENIPFALIKFLEERGYHAEHLKRMGKGGIKNGEVYKIAEENRMWIITRDADFHIVFHQLCPYVFNHNPTSWARDEMIPDEDGSESTEPAVSL